MSSIQDTSIHNNNDHPNFCIPTQVVESPLTDPDSHPNSKAPAEIVIIPSHQELLPLKITILEGYK